MSRVRKFAEVELNLLFPPKPVLESRLKETSDEFKMRQPATSEAGQKESTPIIFAVDVL